MFFMKIIKKTNFSKGFDLISQSSPGKNVIYYSHLEYT